MVVQLGQQIADLDTRIKEIDPNWHPRKKPTRSASAIQKTRLLHRLAKSYPCLLGLDRGPHLDQRSWRRVDIPATSGHHCPRAHGQGDSSMTMFFCVPRTVLSCPSVA